MLPEGAAAGASSFGMSGVNAHAVLRAPAAPSGQRAPELPWRRGRHWMAPQAHALLFAMAWERHARLCR